MVREAEAAARSARKRANAMADEATQLEQDAAAARRLLQRHRVAAGDAPVEPVRLEAVPAPLGEPEYYAAMFAASDFKTKSRLDIIVHILREERRPMGTAEIHAIMIEGGRTDKIERVRNAMYDLHIRDRVAKLGRGKWTVPELVPELADTTRRGAEFVAERLAGDLGDRLIPYGKGEQVP